MEPRMAIFAIAIASLLLISGCAQTGGSSATTPPTTNNPITPPALQSGNANAEEIPPAPPNDNSAQVKEIQITATKFQFSPSAITVKKGDRVKLTLTNADGTHGISLPAFNVELKPGPGETKSVEFTADKEGEQQFFCNIYCGDGHAEMVGSLIVEPA